MLDNVDNAIAKYLAKFIEKLKKETHHINVTHRVIQEALEYDIGYQSLIRLKTKILNTSIPKTIIILDDDGEKSIFGM